MHHGFLPRSPLSVPTGSIFEPGMFGRMFPTLPPFAPDDSKLEALGQAMREADAEENDLVLDNPGIPAGFTYLGQFVDHDMTFDTTTLPEQAVDPQAVHNFRTPKLDLDCLYGLGPTAQPYLYSRAEGVKQFLVGICKASEDQDKQPIGELPNDLPRSPEQFALIGDPRNDENLLVAQTHLAFLKFHNKLVAQGGASFEEVRRQVIWHYQWIVLHDFVGRLVEPAVLRDVLDNGRRFYLFENEPFIPVEFAVAAYRMGHSMVRAEYDHNRVFGPDGRPERNVFTSKLDILFTFSGLSSDGQRLPLPSNWAIDWRRFYELNRPAGMPFNPSRRIDPLLNRFMHDIPGLGSLPVRNLLRGKRAGLPSGQAVAALMGFTSLTPQQIGQGHDGQIATQQGLDVATPLWYYILKEAQVVHQGLRLGPVGSRILAEVFVGLLQGDANSYLAQSPQWKPELPGAVPGEFKMTDLLIFVDDLNPVGGP